MADTSLSRARERAAALRADSRRARERRESRYGTATDRLTSMTVDEFGQLVGVEFAADVAEAGADRWAVSLLTVHRRACDAVSVPPISPDDREAVHSADRRMPPRADAATDSRPLAPEQQQTRRATEAMVDRMAAASAEQATLLITGTADQVWLTFDGAMLLVEARTTPAALQAGPTKLAAAVAQAWEDARRQLTAVIGLGGQDEDRR